MADLNASLILDGVDSTHPTTAIPWGTSMQQAADTVATQQQTQNSKVLTGLQVQGMQLQQQQAALELQQKQMQLQNVNALGKAYAQLRGALSSQPAASAPAADPSVVGPTGGSATTPTQSAGSTASPAAGTTAAAPGTGTPVLPAGVQPDWTVDKAINWYIDGDGKPVSFAQGPALRPDGSPNMQSAHVRNALTDLIVKNGGSPAFAMATASDNENHANEVDTGSAERYEKLQTARAKAAEVQKTQQELITQEQQHTGDQAFYIQHSPNPAASFLNAYGSNQSFRNAVNSQIDPKQPLTGPSDPRITQILGNLANASNVKASKATYDETVARTDQSIQATAASKVDAAVKVGGLEVQAGKDLAETTTNAARSAGILRQANQVEQLQSYVNQLRTGLTPGQRASQIQLSAVPAFLQPYVQSKGMVTKDSDGNPSVQLPALIKAVNDEMGLLDSTVTTNEGVKGAMGSDLRAKMQAQGAGELKLSDNDATWQAKLALRQNYIEGARGVAGNLLDTSNARASAIVAGANAGGAKLDVNQFTVPRPEAPTSQFPGQAPKANLPLSGKTVTGAQLQQYMDANKVDLNTAFARLKALGAQF